jgi:hypothetical protein
MSALRETCSGLPDKRRGKNVQYLMADIGMAAFSVFFMQSPSFLAHQRHLADGYGHGRSNCETLFGMERIPSDNHVRDMAPECFHALFSRAVKALEAGGGLTAFRRLGDHVLIAFDGTEYHRSTKLHCACCSTRKRSGGATEYFHALVAATLVAPGHSRVVPLAACRTEVYSMIANDSFVGANVHRTRDRAQSALLRSPIELASRCLGCI